MEYWLLRNVKNRPHLFVELFRSRYLVGVVGAGVGGVGGHHRSSEEEEQQQQEKA